MPQYKEWTVQARKDGRMLHIGPVKARATSTPMEVARAAARRWQEQGYLAKNVGARNFTSVKSVRASDGSRMGMRGGLRGYKAGGYIFIVHPGAETNADFQI